MTTWRENIGRAALPLLAASAAWGVYQYNLLFVPWFVAVLSAVAFEAVYVALAVTQTDQPRRALAVSLAAVGVSVLYNTLAALFHRRPDLLDSPALLMDVALAALHGIPLAVVAYNVAALLMHAPRHVVNPLVQSLQAELAETRNQLTLAQRETQIAIQIVNQVAPGVNAVDSQAAELKRLIDSGETVSSAARTLGISRTTAHKRLKGVGHES